MGFWIIIGSIIMGITYGFGPLVFMLMIAGFLIIVATRDPYDDIPSDGGGTAGGSYSTTYLSNEQARRDSQAAQTYAANQAWSQHQSNMRNQRY